MRHSVLCVLAARAEHTDPAVVVASVIAGVGAFVALVLSAVRAVRRRRR
ncbi:MULTISPECIES: hypothetical protein [Streptomyces]